MQPKTLLAIFAFAIVLLVLFLHLTAEDESLLEPENTGPPEVSLQAAPADGIPIEPARGQV